MKCYFDDYEFSFQFLRVLGVSIAGGSDISECLTTAYRIRERDFESWYREWRKTAERVHKIADACAGKGHGVSARDAYLRASSYYRSAEFFLHGDTSDPRIHETSALSRECFRNALPYFATLVEPVEILYENTTLPGYFFAPDNSGTPRPTIIFNTGFDGTAEELYFILVTEALKRGYNALTFEGPGQGSVIREQRIPFRHDWENVVTPVMDYLVTRPDVVPEKIVIEGISMGGYLAPRAAAYEHRLAACVANGGVFEADFTKRPEYTDEMLDMLYHKPEEFDTAMQESAEQNTSYKWALEHGMYVFGAKTPHDWLIKSTKFTMKECVDKVLCPVLVIDVENEQAFKGKAKMLYDALKCEKTWMYFTKEEGAEEHCQIGAGLVARQRIFDWIDETLTNRH
jgi:dienelactone hydrolase